MWSSRGQYSLFGEGLVVPAESQQTGGWSAQTHTGFPIHVLLEQLGALTTIDQGSGIQPERLMRNQNWVKAKGEIHPRYTSAFKWSSSFKGFHLHLRINHKILVRVRFWIEVSF